MKIIIFATALGATAAAYMGQIINSFPNTSGSHTGMAADANYIYTVMWAPSPGHPIGKLDRWTGSFIGSYASPLAAPRAMEYAGDGYIIVNDGTYDTVGKFVAATGSLVSTWTYVPGYREGLCTDYSVPRAPTPPTYVYQSYLTTIYVSTTTGSLINSFTVQNTYSRDLAWDYGNRWIWYGNYNDEYVYGMTVNGSIMASWRVPNGVSNPEGIAYYGEYLYVDIASTTPNYIWVYHCPNIAAVTPASWGRIKATFR